MSLYVSHLVQSCQPIKSAPSKPREWLSSSLQGLESVHLCLNLGDSWDGRELLEERALRMGPGVDVSVAAGELGTVG